MDRARMTKQHLILISILESVKKRFTIACFTMDHAIVKRNLQPTTYIHNAFDHVPIWYEHDHLALRRLYMIEQGSDSGRCIEPDESRRFSVTPAAGNLEQLAHGGAGGNRDDLLLVDHRQHFILNLFVGRLLLVRELHVEGAVDCLR